MKTARYKEDHCLDAKGLQSEIQTDDVLQGTICSTRPDWRSVREATRRGTWAILSHHSVGTQSRHSYIYPAQGVKLAMQRILASSKVNRFDNVGQLVVGRNGVANGAGC